MGIAYYLSSVGGFGVLKYLCILYWRLQIWNVLSIMTKTKKHHFWIKYCLSFGLWTLAVVNYIHTYIVWNIIFYTTCIVSFQKLAFLKLFEFEYSQWRGRRDTLSTERWAEIYVHIRMYLLLKSVLIGQQSWKLMKNLSINMVHITD